VKLSPVLVPQRPKGLRIEALAVTDPRFEIDAQAATIEIFDTIGDGGVTPARVSAALRSIGEKPVTVQINSPGGDVFAGLAVFNLLRGHSQKVTTQVLGLAASAASVIAMAGEDIQIARGAMVMIHRAAGGAMGDAGVMRQMADALDKVDATLTGIYAARTGLPAEQIVSMMADETFLTSDEAVGLGFADTLLDRDALSAPRMAASAVPQSKRELEEQFRRLGFSRSVSARMTGAAWAARQNEAENHELDLEAIANAITQNVAAVVPRHSR
jgi:ATP-dependent Clp protease protease subunit